jgi:hypothetical protein
LNSVKLTSELGVDPEVFLVEYLEDGIEKTAQRSIV